MDQDRKRYLAAGVIVGTLLVGLALLFRRTPREKRVGTLASIARDVLAFVKVRYGVEEPTIALAEKALDRFEERVIHPTA